MIAIAADCSETFHDCLSKGFKSACKRPESGASRSPSRSELEAEWHSAPEKKIRSEARETKLSEPATFDDEHQSTRGFLYPEVHNIPVGIVYFVVKFEVIYSTWLMFRKFDYFKSLCTRTRKSMYSRICSY